MKKSVIIIHIIYIIYNMNYDDRLFHVVNQPSNFENTMIF